MRRIFSFKEVNVMQVYLIVALIFSLVVAIFAVQNTAMAEINFLTWSFDVPLVLVILGAAAAGALVLYLFGLFKQVGYWMKMRQLNHNKAELEKQVKKLEEQLNSCKEQAGPPEETPKTAKPDVVKPEEVQPKEPVTEEGKPEAAAGCGENETT